MKKVLQYFCTFGKR